MSDHVLTLNAGSSSIKFALFSRTELSAPRCVGQIDGIGLHARLTIRDHAGRVIHNAAVANGDGSAPSHRDALAAVLRWLDETARTRVVAVGHRIVHGGVRFEQPVRVDVNVLGALAALESLAPLHQPHNVGGVRAAMDAFAGVPQVACFDTAFHRSQPALNQRFALPQRLHDAGVRRYGFHGLSYESIRDQLVAADPAGAGGRVVVAHLGNGASMCAMFQGRSVATTMSFSPLDGLPMGTRCGRLDAAVVLHLLQHHAMSAERVATLLFRESGLLGMSGVSSDMRELQASPLATARAAIDYFVEHVLRELAGMTAALRGIDLLVFTGGIGENAVALRRRIIEGAGWMGIALDGPANARGDALISAPGSAVEVRVLHTNEEAVIARHTATIALSQVVS